jgi:hypothetical protein
LNTDVSNIDVSNADTFFGETGYILSSVDRIKDRGVDRTYMRTAARLCTIYGLAQVSKK